MRSRSTTLLAYRSPSRGGNPLSPGGAAALSWWSCPAATRERQLEVGNVDFEVGVIRFEDGLTTSGGHAGNKGWCGRSR